MRLREATLADAAAIAELHADSWRNTYRGAYPDEYLDGPVFEDRRRIWQERLSTAAPGQYVIVAEGEDGSLIGLACAYGGKDPVRGTLLDNLHVRLDRQRSGTGRKLVAQVARWCLAAYPEEALYLGVLEQNTRAQAFYRALGARDSGGETVPTPGGGSTRTRWYTWTLAQLPTLAAN